MLPTQPKSCWTQPRAQAGENTSERRALLPVEDMGSLLMVRDAVHLGQCHRFLPKLSPPRLTRYQPGWLVHQLALGVLPSYVSGRMLPHRTGVNLAFSGRNILEGLGGASPLWPGSCALGPSSRFLCLYSNLLVGALAATRALPPERRVEGFPASVFAVNRVP